MKIAYMALAVRKSDTHAGFTHPYYLTRALSSHTEVSLFLSGAAPAVSRERELRMIELAFPSSGSVSLNPAAVLRSFLLVRRELAGTDMIHERFRYNPIDLMLAGGRKYVLEFNDLSELYPLREGRTIRGNVLRRKLERCDAIVTQTETLREHIRRLTDRPVFVVPNGVDTTLFHPDAGNQVRSRYGIADDEILVTYAGSFRPWHGITMIVDAAARMARMNARVKFMLIGDGPLFGYAQEASRDLDTLILTRGVAMHRVPSYLASSDICIAPFSAKEFEPVRTFGFWWCPVKLFEYMASGKPIVSVDYPEVRKIVEDCALLSAPDSSRDFAEKIETLSADEELRREKGRKARSLSLEKHSWDLRCRALLSIYQSI